MDFGKMDTSKFDSFIVQKFITIWIVHFYPATSFFFDNYHIFKE